MRNKIISAGLITALSLGSLPRQAIAQTGALEIPCIASGVCVVVATVLVAGVYYYVLQNQQTGRKFRVPVPNSGFPGVQPSPQAGPRGRIREQRIQEPNIPGHREIHASADREGCQRMARRFQREGRRLQLVEIRRVRNAARDGGVMQYQCIFIGADAQTGYYEDRHR